MFNIVFFYLNPGTGEFNILLTIMWEGVICVEGRDFEDRFLDAYDDKIFCRDESLDVDWISLLFVDKCVLEVIWLSNGIGILIVCWIK